MKTKLLTALTFLILLSSCSTTKEYKWVPGNKAHFEQRAEYKKRAEEKKKAEEKNVKP